MKMTLVCHDIPYPAIHGGRIDMWRRIKAFAQIGVELQLICWFDRVPDYDEIAEIKKYVNSTYLIPFQYNLCAKASRMLNLFRYPLEVTSRLVRGQQLNDLISQVRAFKPHVVWLDGIHGGDVASQLSQCFDIPIVTRCHNIEHLYYQRLFNSAIGTSKIKRYLSVSHLEQYEKSLLKNSLLFYDISPEDLNFWKSHGFKNGRYLPPLMEFNNSQNLDNNYQKNHHDSQYDVVFLGNLYSNNNVAGIIWFLTQVLPEIRSQLPNVKVLIAGAKPINKIRQLCENIDGVDLSINPSSSTEIYNSGRVLINPVLTGSGVSIKSLEMLVAGKPIVSTPQGIAGLPLSVKQYFKIASETQSFAAAIVNLLCNVQKTHIEQKLLESLFGTQVIHEVVSDIKSLI
ncbi:MAG: glycosyltransferase [Rivularia sp. T60_A2020_040]|nr:glycosyltransferase [Rivularia sp. T60_A2020_040]